MLLYNEVKLVEDEVVRESRLMHIPISTQMRQTVPFNVERTDLYEQDLSHWSHDSNQENDIPYLKKENLFKLKR